MTKHGTVLLIDEDADDVSLLRRAFEEAGVANPMRTAAGFKEAVKYLSGNGQYADRAHFPVPFLILVNLSTRTEEGFAFLRWLYERPGLRKRFIVIVLTPTNAEQDIQLAYELGVQSCLPMPGEYPQLAAAVRRLKEYWIELNVPPADFH